VCTAIIPATASQVDVPIHLSYIFSIMPRHIRFQG
jgi:hypothetical protein